VQIDPSDPAVGGIASNAIPPHDPQSRLCGCEPSPAPAPEPPVEPVLAGSYIDGLKAAGLSEITVDELIALKVQGVTPNMCVRFGNTAYIWGSTRSSG